MAVTETCVTPTDLAAFLEGSLTGEERDRMVQHLNHCPDCFERYIGAARLLDAIEEEEASALSAADGNRAVDPGLLPGLDGKLLMPISLPRRSQQHAWLLPLAAVILLFVGAAYLWNALPPPRAARGAAEPAPWLPSLRPKPDEIEWATELFRVFSTLPEARREAFDEEIRYIVPGHQGNGPEGVTIRRQAFQMGARWVDLHPVLRSQSTTLTERALQNLSEILRKQDTPPRDRDRRQPSLPSLSGPPPCRRLLFPQAPEPKEIDVCLGDIERVFRDRPEFALGRWTEATRLAIAAGTYHYFTYTSVREFPERFLEDEGPSLNDGVRAELERADKLLEGGLSPGEEEALEAVLQELARFYE